MATVGIEIERKYRLRAAPDAAVLEAHGAVPRRLEQIYLAGDPPGRRIRRTEKADGSIEHRLTRKERLRHFAFLEEESVIDAAAFEELLAQADPSRRRIRKIRHVVPHGEQVLEIDVFDVPEGLILVEVELGDDDELVELPDWLGEWVDVTGDPTYLNANLARAGSIIPHWDGD
jgi:CYTH domain-containing protein